MPSRNKGLSIGAELDTGYPSLMSVVERSHRFPCVHIPELNHAVATAYRDAIATQNYAPNPTVVTTQGLLTFPSMSEYSNYGRGLSKQRVGNQQGAIADYDIALRLLPNNADIYSARAAARFSIKVREGEIADYKQFIHLVPQNTGVYLYRGVAYADPGENQKALADWRQAAKLYEQKGKTHNL